MHDFKSILAEGTGHYLIHSSKEKNNPTKSAIKTIAAFACSYGAVWGPLGVLAGTSIATSLYLLKDSELGNRLGL